MIALHNIAKSYPLPRGKKVVLDDVNITFRPGENMGILGLNGAGKSTLMRIIGGAELPDSGKVVRKSRVSWPIGFAGGFHGSLTGRENLRFTSRIYGSDIRKVTEFVEDFSELGPYMDMPVRTYSSVSIFISSTKPIPWATRPFKPKASAFFRNAKPVQHSSSFHIAFQQYVKTAITLRFSLGAS